MPDMPVSTWEPRDGWPKRQRITVHEDGSPDGRVLEVEIPTETGQLAVITIRHRWPDALDGGRHEYSFEFAGELVDISSEGITAAIQLAFLALQERRAFELGLVERASS